MLISLFFKRVLSTIPTFFIILTLTFFLMKAVPGGPFDEERALPLEVKASINAKYHLDRPVYEQYYSYLKNFIQGDLGHSYRYGEDRKVIDILRETFPVSALLGFLSLILSCGVGFLLGALSAYFKDSWIDKTILLFSVSGISIPNFLLASFLILIFSMKLDLLPPALWEGWTSAVLPTLTLALRPLCTILRLVRVSLLEVLEEDYIRTAQAKGASPSRVLFRHAVKNSLIPVLSILGPLVASIVTGSFVVEVIFAVPGMGRHFVTAVLDRDYTLVMGLTLIYGILLVGCNFLVDIAYSWIDPRIRVEA